MNPFMLPLAAAVDHAYTLTITLMLMAGFAAMNRSMTANAWKASEEKSRSPTDSEQKHQQHHKEP